LLGYSPLRLELIQNHLTVPETKIPKMISTKPGERVKGRRF